MHLEEYTPVARIAEFITVVSLPMAVLSIVLDLGRPDRIFNLFMFGRGQSPLLWDMMSMTAYFVSSVVYLYMSMRSDLAECAEVMPKNRWLYKFLTFGYKDSVDARERNEKTLRWMAIAIIPIMVSVHTVVSWVFGLMASRPGWYSALFGIYFVIGAVASGVAIVITVAWIFRSVYSWEEYLTDKIFRGLAWALRLVLLVYLYMWISDIFTVLYAGPEAEVTVMNAIIFGDYSLLFWVSLLGGVIIPAVILFVPLFKREAFNVKATVLASVLINLGMFTKRVLIVIPPLTIPRLYDPGVYFPTATEISIMLSTVWIAVGLYALFVKIFPMIELDVTRLETTTAPPQYIESPVYHDKSTTQRQSYRPVRSSAKEERD
jgi:molybdopterin-containing oxidoreductase family membrane subunit